MSLPSVYQLKEKPSYISYLSLSKGQAVLIALDIVLGYAVEGISSVVFVVPSGLAHLMVKEPESGADDGDTDGRSTEVVAVVPTPTNNILEEVTPLIALLYEIVYTL
jgi:hypothetical protein